MSHIPNLIIDKNLLTESEKKVYEKVIYYSALPYKLSDHSNKTFEAIRNFILKYDEDIWNECSDDMISDMIKDGRKIGFYNFSD